MRKAICIYICMYSVVLLFFEARGAVYSTLSAPDAKRLKPTPPDPAVVKKQVRRAHMHNPKDPPKAPPRTSKGPPRNFQGHPRNFQGHPKLVLL